MQHKKFLLGIVLFSVLGIGGYATTGSNEPVQIPAPTQKKVQTLASNSSNEHVQNPAPSQEKVQTPPSNSSSAKVQQAEKILYGSWFVQGGTKPSYSFNASNLKFVGVGYGNGIGDVDPVGESNIHVSLKKDDGSWTTNDILCWVTWENDHYEMHLIRRNAKGNEVQGNDCGVIYIKR